MPPGRASLFPANPRRLPLGRHLREWHSLPCELVKNQPTLFLRLVTYGPPPAPKNLANWFPGPLKIQILFAVLFRAARINRCCFVQEQSAGSAGFFRKFSKFAIGRQLSWRANYAGQTRTKRAGISRGGSPLHGKLNFFSDASPSRDFPSGGK